MIVLAADTSTTVGSVALLDGTELLAELRVAQGKGHAERLLPATEALLRLTGLELRQVELLCTGLGPGGFTGLRIGVVTMRTLGYALGRPVRGVSSLEALCQPWLGAPGLLVPTIDAHKGEVYAAVFRTSAGGAERTGVDAVLGPRQLAEQLLALALEAPVLVFGTGAERYRKELEGLPRSVSVIPGGRPSAADVARCALGKEGRDERRAPVVPNYVRKSDAELNWNRKSPE